MIKTVEGKHGLYYRMHRRVLRDFMGRTGELSRDFFLMSQLLAFCFLNHQFIVLSLYSWIIFFTCLIVNPEG